MSWDADSYHRFLTRTSDERIQEHGLARDADCPTCPAGRHEPCINPLGVPQMFCCEARVESLRATA